MIESARVNGIVVSPWSTYVDLKGFLFQLQYLYHRKYLFLYIATAARDKGQT